MLTRADAGGRSGPISGNKVAAPEMGGRGEKFEGAALAFVCCVTQKHDAAFLLFLREWVGNDEDRVHVEGLVQIHQAAVGVDHDGFTGLAESAAVRVLPRDDHAHAHKDPGTTSNLVEYRFRHNSFMLRHNHFPVNETVNVVFPLCNLGAAVWSHNMALCFHV